MSIPPVIRPQVPGANLAAAGEAVIKPMPYPAIPGARPTPPAADLNSPPTVATGISEIAESEDKSNGVHPAVWALIVVIFLVGLFVLVFTSK